MKSILSLILLFSFLMVNLSSSVILANYEINKKEITQKYCINKDKPQMHCCGKCQLRKKLAEQQEQQKLPTFPDIKTDFSPVHQSRSIYSVYQLPYIPLSKRYNLSTQFEGRGIFHPPGC